MSEAAKTPDERIAAAEERREALRRSEAAAKKLQRAADMDALAKYEEELGYERVLRVDIGGWKSGEGAATLAIVRIPKSSEAIFKRFEETVTKAKAGSSGSLDAGHKLADACLLYPSRTEQKELYEATFELAPGLRSKLAQQIVEAVQGTTEEEKKD